ncbi:MAG: carbohydrate ABC transporter permease [Candidatus Omnitrophota bacterium]|jgi:multiple sugar transport system permease protein/raffinose/stachyose/melibiose transport system permease protein|nr:carbohydrate ABC transporter permease [Candidatus Omnitrophota bacterium]
MKDSVKYKFNQFFGNFFAHFFLIIVAASCLFPLLWMLGSSLKTQQAVFSDMSLFPKDPLWINFYHAWVKGGFGVYFFNSVIYTVTVVFGIVMVSSLAAFAFSRLKFPGKNVLFYMFLAAMMIPLPGSFVPLYVLMTKLHLVNTRIGYILCMINVGLSFSIYLLKTFFDKMPPALEDAARIDGCSKLGIWWNVALPLARPAIAVIVIFNSLNVWNEYILATLIFSSKSLMPLQRGLMIFQGTHLTEYPLLMAGITITVLPIILVYLAMQKHIIKGITAGAIVG